MKRLSAFLVLLFSCLTALPAFADLKVATALSDLASVAQYVGGKHVTAISLCKGYEDPHFVPAKPSLMKAIQDADVFVSVGLELDGGWLPLVIPGSRNPKIQPGAEGFVDASEGIENIAAQAFETGSIMDVRISAQRLRTQLLDFVGHRVDFGLIPAAGDHRRAGPRKRECDGLADSACAAQHHGNFVLQREQIHLYVIFTGSERSHARESVTPEAISAHAFCKAVRSACSLVDPEAVRQD